ALERPAHAGEVRLRSGLQPLTPLLGEDRVGDTRVGRAVALPDEAGGFEAVQQPRHSGWRQQEPGGEIDPPHRAFGLAREHEQGLVVVDREAVLGAQLRAEEARQRAVPAQEARPGVEGRRRLCGQYLTTHVSMLLLLRPQVYRLRRENTT